MSFQRPNRVCSYHILTCDSPCGAWIYLAGAGSGVAVAKAQMELWQDAQRQGWVARGEKHFCAVCVASSPNPQDFPEVYRGER